MRFFYAFLFAGLLLPARAWLQPANDDCENAIFLTDVSNWCSDFAEYNNTGATVSPVVSPSCFAASQENNDVWFAFVAEATDVNISVVGNTNINQGGSLDNPQFTLYSGGCGNLSEEACTNDSFGSGAAQSFAGPLIIGETYYIQVSGGFGNEGTFTLCVNNFNLVPAPSGDCNSGVVLCDKSPFTVPSVSGVGLDPNEIANTTCGCPIVESSSTWYKWTCEDPGSLTFTLTPLNPSDDIDFVIYELPSGLDNCADKEELRCMASGENINADFSTWQACTGPTGLSLNDGDNSESCGCQPGNNNFAAAIEMEAGRSYALVVNNFTNSGSGFSVEFGGTGTFRGPQASFLAEPQTICVGESISFIDNSTAPDGISNWEWNFGSGATPQTGSSPTPDEVTYNTPGVKSVLLRVTSSDGCLVSFISTVTVECCDDHFALDGDPVDLLCGDIPTGAIDLSVTNDYGPYVFNWTTGDQTEDLSGLDLGTYTVSIVDDVGCDTTASFTIEGPPPILLDPFITMPTCNGGTDGAITINTEGGTPPYEYDFGSGFTGSNTIENLPVGDYPVTIRDGNGCEKDTLIEVRELELELDPTFDPITRPSCFSLSDGAIEVIVNNGLPPYEYNYNDGQGWVTSNVIDNLPAGTYTVDVRDANLCMGSFTFDVTDFPPLEISLAVTDVSCFGLEDGVVTAAVEGGTGEYTYLWSDGQTGPEAVDLPEGDYGLTVTDSNGCEIESAASVAEPDPLFVEIADVIDVLCFGDLTGEIEVVAFGGASPFEFSTDGVNFQPEPRFTGLAAGDYTLTVRDSRGCTITTDTIVRQPPELIVDAGSDQVIQLGFSADIQAVASESPVEFSWTPTSTLDCEDCPDPNATPVRGTNYIVTVINERGCEAVDSIFINVAGDKPIYIPNAITPNGDGFNDGFTVYGGPAARQIRNLKIFSRWGSLVFEADNLPIGEESAGWDGTFLGQPVNSGVFVYLVEVEFIDDSIVIFEGDVTVLQ